MYVYSFGSPGHGKGFFDGLGGALKNKVYSLIQGTKSGGENIAGTSSGYILNVEDVHDALKEYFENGCDGICKNKSKNQVTGPAVCKRGNSGPWSTPVARVHPRTTYHRKIPLRVRVRPENEHGNRIWRVDMERGPESV